METFPVITYTTQTLQLVLIASLPPVIAAAFIGILISLLQALTQIQEQTVAFAFKLIAVSVTLYFVLQVVSTDFILFTERIFDDILLISS